MGNEGARKLALSTLRFEQYTPLDSSLPLRMTHSFQLPTAYCLPPTAHAPKRSDPKGATPRPHTSAIRRKNGSASLQTKEK